MPVPTWQCPIAAEHVLVGLLAFLAGNEDIHLDLAVFLAGFRVVDIATPVEVRDHHHSFFVVVIVQEPPN
jgi:hypothetical protein